MNIRKKILFNPSHIKSTKPDTSDTTTAHTKNSAILDHSKTFRFSNQKTISTRRQRNYLRTLSKDHKDSDLTYNHAASVKKRHIVGPSLSTMSNENFVPIKKSVLGRKFLMDQDELPPLVALKRTDLMTSQQERKLFNYPSSVHVSSNKEILAREEIKKQPTQQQQQQPKLLKPQPQMMILGQQFEEIERRKQKLNSLNVASFYTTQKSIALSKYSIRSRENNLEGKMNSDKKESEYEDQKISRFASIDDKTRIKQDCVKQSPEKPLQEPEEEMDESIVQEIQKNESMAKDKPSKINRQQNSSNEWSETLKSSYADSLNKNKQKLAKQGDNNKNNQKGNDSNEQSSLCQSEVINSQQVQERKNTHRNPYKTIQNESKGQNGQKQRQQNNSIEMKKQLDSQGDQLCQSYQVETPHKNAH